MSLFASIDEIWIDPEVRNHPLAARITAPFPPEKIKTGTPAPLTSRPFPEAIAALKRRLFVTRTRGTLVKPCPGSPGRICCGYWVINAMTHCPMDCHYCILQTYLSVPAMTVFVDEDRIQEEITRRLASRPGHFCRFGTGELTDSLVHDALTGFASRMVPFFAETKTGILELKTKTAAVTALKGLDPKGHTVISWSINPPFLIREVEPKTAPLVQRLSAARACQEMGYWIGLHFDPVIRFDGWERDYYDVVEALSQTLDPERILWISVAGLRYNLRQKDLILRRFSRTPLFLGEFFREEDGKFRYLQVQRVAMYRKLIGWLREWSPDLFIYFCMENPRVWKQTFPHPPRNTRELDERFHENIRKHLHKRG